MISQTTLVLMLAALAIGSAISISVGIKAQALGVYLRIMDVPDPYGGRKRHERPTPLVGGLGVIVPVLAVTALAIVFDTGASLAQRGDLLWVGLATLAMFLVGLVDDRFELSARPRLLFAVLTLTLALLITPALSLSFLRFTFWPDAIVLSTPWATAFTILCLVGFTNAVNMADGKNGVVIGMCLIWTGLMALVAPVVLWPTLAAMAVALAVMLWFNWRSRLFLGDAGSYGLATLFGLMAVAIYQQRFVELPADVICVWFAVPVLDCLRVLTARLLRGQSPFTPDRDHLHHHLGAVSSHWAVGYSIYMTLVAVPSIIATMWPDMAVSCFLVLGMVYAALIIGTARGFRTAGAA